MDKTSTSEITHTRSSKEYHKSVNSSFGKILPLLAKVTGQIIVTTTWVMFCTIHACFQSLDRSHSSSGFPYSPQLNNTTSSNIKRHRSCLTSWHSIWEGLHKHSFYDMLFWGVSLKPTLVWPYYHTLISSDSYRRIAGLFLLHPPNLLQSYFWDELLLLCTFLQCFQGSVVRKLCS